MKVPHYSADMTDQIKFDMHWRQLMLLHQVEGGPGDPLLFPISAMRGWLRYYLYLWESDEISEDEFRDGLHTMLTGNFEETNEPSVD